MIESINELIDELDHIQVGSTGGSSRVWRVCGVCVCRVWLGGQERRGRGPHA